MPTSISVLLLGDSHIGFDHPLRPRVARRHRGQDFLANLERALGVARTRHVDMIVHGGDVFHRSQPPAALAAAAYELLCDAAEAGTVVFVVPGNHERGRLPYRLLASHPQLHVFDAPRTVRLAIRGVPVAVSGFPFARLVGGECLTQRLACAGLHQDEAALRLVCFHQAVEGAQVGAHNYTFRSGPDVIPAGALPHGVAAALSGHIHRAQTLRHSLTGTPLPCPVVYAGSLERTAFAERGEEKGCTLLTFVPNAAGGRLLSAERVALPTRPMFELVCPSAALDPARLRALVSQRLSSYPRDAIVYLILRGGLDANARAALSTRWLRAAAPTMNVLAREDPPSPWRVQT